MSDEVKVMTIKLRTTLGLRSDEAECGDFRRDRAPFSNLIVRRQSSHSEGGIRSGRRRVCMGATLTLGWDAWWKMSFLRDDSAKIKFDHAWEIARNAKSGQVRQNVVNVISPARGGWDRRVVERRRQSRCRPTELLTPGVGCTSKGVAYGGDVVINKRRGPVCTALHRLYGMNLTDVV